MLPCPFSPYAFFLITVVSLKMLKPEDNKGWLTVSTMLCSTKFTQNSSLARLLKGKLTAPDLELVLTEIIDNSEKSETFFAECFKLMTDIFQALFAIFVNSPTKHTASVLKVLVLLCKQLSVQKFVYLVPTFNTYVSEHFTAKEATVELLGGIIACLQAASGQPTLTGSTTDLASRAANKMLQTFPFLFQLVARGFGMLQAGAARSATMSGRNPFGPAQPIDLVKVAKAATEGVTKVVAELCTLLKSQNEKLVYTCLKHAGAIFTELGGVADGAWLVSLATSIFDAAPSTTANDTTVKFKLEFISTLMRSKIFVEHKSRKSILPVILDSFLQMLDSGRLPVAVLKAIGEFCGLLRPPQQGDSAVLTESQIAADDDLLLVLTKLLKPCIKKATEMTSTNAGGSDGETASATLATFIALLRLADDARYSAFTDRLGSRDQLTDFVNSLLNLFVTLVEKQPFPKVRNIVLS